MKWTKDEKGKLVPVAGSEGLGGPGEEGGEYGEGEEEEEEAGVGPHLDPEQYFPTLLPLRQHAPDVHLPGPEMDQLPTSGIPEDLALTKVGVGGDGGGDAEGCMLQGNGSLLLM